MLDECALHGKDANRDTHLNRTCLSIKRGRPHSAAPPILHVIARMRLAALRIALPHTRRVCIRPANSAGLLAAFGHQQLDFGFVDTHHCFAEVFGQLGDHARVGVVGNGFHDSGCTLLGVAALEDA